MIRRLVPEDAAGLRGLLRRCGDYAQLERGRGYDGADAAALLVDDLDGGEIGAGRRWVLEGAAGPDGVGVLEFGFPAPRDAYVGLLLLAPEARGRGHGSALAAAMEAEALALGCPAIHAAVLEANTRGRAFWEGRGYASVLRVPDAEVGARRHVFHRLRKPLS